MDEQAIMREVNKILKPEYSKNNPATTYFPIPENQYLQRKYTKPTEDVERFLDTHNLERPLLTTDVGIAGDAKTDRAIYALSYFRNKDKINKGKKLTPENSEKLKNFLQEIDYPNPDKLIKTLLTKEYVSFTLADFARVYYGKIDDHISGAEMSQAMEILKKLDSTFYLFSNEKNKTIKVRRYIIITQFDIDLNDKKNPEIFIELDTEIFQIKKIYGLVSTKYFPIYKYSNRFHNQFLGILTEQATINRNKEEYLLKEYNKNNLLNKRKKITTCIVDFALDTIFSICATEPKYKKNPKYKMQDFEGAMKLAKDLGILIDVLEKDPIGKDRFFSFTIDLYYHEK